MQTCKNIKDWILTDFLDAQTDPATRKLIDSHLLTCGDCRSLVEDVTKNLAAPFKPAVREDVPEHLWSLLKQRIENEIRPVVPADGFMNRLGGFFSFSRLAPALGVLAAIILFSSLFLSHKQRERAQEREQGEYLAFLWKSANSQDSETIVSETPLEKYFL